MSIIHEIKSSSSKYSNNILEFRRYLHKNPELSFKEFNTTSYIYKILKSLDTKNVKKYKPTGVSAIINNSGFSNKCIALRADIDALPLTEQTGLPYASKNKGVMHACGHDAHTAMILGAAMILNNMKNKLNGTVKLIFQPGEEKNPGGASILIKQGVLKNPDVHAIFGQHIIPDIPAAKVGFCPGEMMASQDEIYITIIGKPGHASEPHKAIDPIVIASRVILALQHISSRYTDPYDPLVITVGKITGGTATNIIPREVNLAGTIRTMNYKLRKRTLSLIEKTVRGITSSSGAKYKFDISQGYPELVNNPVITSFASKAATEFLGSKNVIKAKKTMASEDFAYYLKKIPGTFYWIGAGNTASLHTSTMNLDESLLVRGAGFMAYLAWKYLEENSFY